MLEVIGESGPAVLLLPGGAESADGFFPGLAEGLVADPGCRVVLYDRPGTLGSDVGGLLADAPDAIHRTLRELGTGPVVAIGQSLGGAVSLLLAIAHPEDVAGLVLLDPTPVNDPSTAARVGRTMRVTERIARLPGGSRLVTAALRAGVDRTIQRHGLSGEVAATLRRTAGTDIAFLGRAVVGLEELADDFDASRLPDVPAVVVTADRKPGSSVHRVHRQLADALGAPLAMWPRAEHSVHLTHQTEVLEVSRAVVRAAAQQSGAGRD